MRTRTNSSDPVTKSLTVLAYQASPYVVTNHGTVVWMERSSHGLIQDDPSRGRRFRTNGHGVRPFKAVSHDQYSALAQGTPVTVPTSSNNSVIQSTPEILRAFWGTSNSFVTTDVVYSRAVDYPSLVDTGHFDRWQAVKPTMETRASLAVFLYELREITSLWKILPKKHLTFKGRSLTEWNDVLRYANGLHLNYNFGWKPFVRDVCASWRATSSFETRLARYITGMDRNLIRRFRDEPVVETIDKTSPFPPNPFYTIVETGTRTCQFASAFDFVYNSPYRQYAGNEWRFWADTLGLNANPSTIWAVVPWSFVVDWFYDVGGLLKSQESDWLQTAITILQSSYSRKLNGTWTLTFRGAYGGTTLPGITIQFSQYIRRLGLPTFSGLTESLDADKIRLGASLLYGRLS